jgi:hypothetical protein
MRIDLHPGKKYGIIQNTVYTLYDFQRHAPRQYRFGLDFRT